MKEFLTGAECKVRGYSVHVSGAEMKYSPSARNVTTCRIACGGTKSLPAIYIEVVAWDEAAVKFNELVTTKGIAVVASGLLRENRWEYKGQRFHRLELIYLKELEVERDGVLVRVKVDNEAKVDG